MEKSTCGKCMLIQKSPMTLSKKVKNNDRLTSRSRQETAGLANYARQVTPSACWRLWGSLTNGTSRRGRRPIGSRRQHGSGPLRRNLQSQKRKDKNENHSIAIRYDINVRVTFT